MKKFPTLYHKSKNGKIIEWNLSVSGDTITTVWGQIDGKKQIATLICTPKNEGRSNQTSAEEQALKEAEAQHLFQLERKYRLSPDEAEEVILLPMLARSKSISKTEKILFPCHIQPKFDGVRCMCFWNDENTEVLLQSRSGKFYNIPHIASELKMILPHGTILDGELYIHGVGFQTVSSAVKRIQEDTKKVCYRLYDCPTFKGINGNKWIERFEILKSIDLNDSSFISVCDTKTVNNMDEVFEYQAQCLADGYEGAILRTFDGLYLFGHRSKTELLKVKNFIDDEFEIVGWKTGLKGTKEENAIIWFCKTKDGKEFAVRPMGSIEKREEMLKEAKKYIGTMYTVKYFELSDSGTPRFGVGLGWKDDR